VEKKMANDIEKIPIRTPWGRFLSRRQAAGTSQKVTFFDLTVKADSGEASVKDEVTAPKEKKQEAQRNGHDQQGMPQLEWAVYRMPGDGGAQKYGALSITSATSKGGGVKYRRGEDEIKMIIAKRWRKSTGDVPEGCTQYVKSFGATPEEAIKNAPKPAHWITNPLKPRKTKKAAVRVNGARHHSLNGAKPH
jgi:hypothetical protein